MKNDRFFTAKFFKGEEEEKFQIMEQDEQMAGFKGMDFDKVQLKTCLEPGEVSISGEETLKRLKKNKGVRLDAAMLQLLLASPRNIPESWKMEVNGDTPYIHFDGTVLLTPSGDRVTFYFHWCSNSPDIFLAHLEEKRDANDFSAIFTA